MKFLDLNTGYSFDGLWNDLNNFSDWTMIKYVQPEKCSVCGYVINHYTDISKLLNDNSIDIRFSNNLLAENTGNPTEYPHLWEDQFSADTRWIAYRTAIPQSKGYIFWFPNEQSTNITYSMPICILSDTEIPSLTLSIEENDIFSFISDEDTNIDIDGYVFDSPVYSNTITLSPERLGSYYAYVVNITGKSAYEGEFICKINIGNEGYIRVGADFYGEYEPVYVNLSNFGVEIPETVQKAIYDTNVHEDLKDNILINRKFKELFSNYWDIIANKGSYKSLINSLKWFEWDKALTIKEIWKRNEADVVMFDDRELISIFENKILDSFENFSKTTYMSLYYSAFEELDSYDDEYNPELLDRFDRELAETAVRWSKNDMRLKLSLLSQFFGAFFMPIHTSLLHATVEDKVFTNTIKAISSGNSKRDDSFGDFTYIESNIKDNSTFKIGNVRAQVTDNTTFGVKYEQSDKSDISFGVDEFPTNAKIEDIKTFASQYYTGPGAIIPIKLTIPNQQVGDFIKQIIVDFTPEPGREERLVFYDKMRCRDGKFYINFNFLAKTAMDYNIRFMFITGSSKTITHSLDFTVEDTDNIVINVYKVQAKDDRKGLTMEDFMNVKDVEYLFRIFPNNNSDNRKYHYYTLYLPYMKSDNPLYKDYNGIKLTRTVVFDVSNYKNRDISTIRGIMRYEFLEFARYDESNKLKYLIYVSKWFNIDIPDEIIKRNFNVIRNDLGFYPQFHDLKLMTGLDPDNYTVSQYEAVCCAAEINHGYKNERFRYGNLIDTAEWSFINPETGSVINTEASSVKPFVAKSDSIINPGYYDISFNYSLTTGVKNTCKRESAFRIKVI